jgi:hypothetical protein
MFTLTTSDPSSVLLSATLNDPGSASIVLSPASGYSPLVAFGGPSNYYVDCLANGASADITATATGYVSATAHVDCVPPSVSAFLAGGFGGGLSYSDGVPHISAWVRNPPTATLNLFATNPNNPNDGNYVFAVSDGSRIPVQVQALDPTIVAPSVSTVLVSGRQILGCGSPFSPPACPGPDMTITPLRVGTTYVAFSSPQLLPGPSEQLQLAVDFPFTTPAATSIPGGFQYPYYFPCNTIPPANTTITVTSGDPGSLVISNTSSTPGSGSMTLSGCGNIFLQALASTGQVPVTISITGFDSVTFPVTLTTASVRVFGPLLYSPTLAPGQTSSISATFAFTPNPQPPLPVLTFASSNDQVLQVMPLSQPLSAFSQVVTFLVQGVAAGTATVTLNSSNGAVPPANAIPLQITVAPRPVQFPNFEVGKDLVEAISVPVPAGMPANSAFTVSTSDPTEALVSLDSTTPGQVQISSSASNGVIGFYVFGLSNSGTAQITLTVAGAAPAAATATLDPSGIGWANDFLSSSLQSHASQAYLAAYALDPGTLAPIALQNLRPGLTPTVQIQSDHPGVAVLMSNSITLQTSGATPVGLQNVGPGDSHITLTQPAGFATPVSRQSLTYRVVTP